MFSVEFKISDEKNRVYDALLPEGATVSRDRSRYQLKKIKSDTLINITATDFTALKSTLIPLLKNIELIEKIEKK
jgi:tRNA threonylcarbamoyladenosine modification (KEOPS) complex  Pcc1 subunit